MKGKILIGWGKADITPQGPVMLAGQMFNRIAEEVLDPLCATALALEKDGEKIIMISADLAGIRMPLMEKIREKVTSVTGLRPEEILCSATHTHTAPQYGSIVPYELRHEPGVFPLAGNHGIKIDEIRKKYPSFADSEMYFDFLVEKISSCAVSAWEERKEGKISYGYGTAAVGENRRIVFRDRGSVMYGAEEEETILHAEGHVDHSVNILTTYTPEGELTGILVNIACPAQVCEALSVVSADYWHEVREGIAEIWGKKVFFIPQCSAAGDQSPHKLLNRRADERMMLLKGIQEKKIGDWTWGKRAFDHSYAKARKKEIGRRILAALEDVIPYIASSAEESPVMKKGYKLLELPPRRITQEEAEEAAKSVERLENQVGDGYAGSILWNKGVIARYNDPPESVPMELHTLRLGDIAFASNSFEFYLDYGDRIKGRSRAIQTFLVQLSAGRGTYLPTARSGTQGYGSVPASCIVTVEGGEMIVEETLKALEELFRE